MDLFGETIEEISVPAAEAAPVVEEIPESGGHPRNTYYRIGHEDVEKILLGFYASGRVPHGLVFAGLQGIGKATMAYRFARFLLKHGTPDSAQDSLFGAPEIPAMLDIDPADPVARRIASGGHPDLFCVERAYDESKDRLKSGVDVKEIRRVAPFLRMTAAEGGWRIVIIDDADTMNRNAQNALLKILEEPPANTILILVTHRLGALIPTIRSRTRVVNFQPLGNDEILALFEKQGMLVSEENAEILSSLAEGSFGRAFEYAEQGGGEMLERIVKHLARAPRWNWAEIHAFADELSRTGRDEPYAAFETFMLWIFHTLAKAKARGGDIIHSSLENETFNTILRQSSLSRLLKICDRLQEHFEKTDRGNLDKRQGVMGAFMLIAEES